MKCILQLIADEEAGHEQPPEDQLMVTDANVPGEDNVFDGDTLPQLFMQEVRGSQNAGDFQKEGKDPTDYEMN